MKQKRRSRSPIWSILFGIICFLLLAILLGIAQTYNAYSLCYNNALSELEQIRDTLVSQVHYEELDEILEDIYKQILQKTSLLLTDQELSDEKIAAIVENQDIASGMLIFQEDGTLLCSHGDVSDDPDFLNTLRASGQEKAPDGSIYRAIPFRDNLYLAICMSADLLDTGYHKTQYDIEAIAELASGMTGEVLIVGKYTQRFLYGPASVMGRKLTDFLLTPLESGLPIHMMAIGDSLKLMVSLDHQDYLLLSLFDPEVLVERLGTAITPALIGFGCLIFLLLIYVRFIRTDMRLGRLGKIHYIQLGKKHYLNTILLRKLVGFALIGITCMTCAVYCLQLLIRSDEQRQSAESRMNIAVRILEESQANVLEHEKQNMDSLTELAQEVRSVLAFNPALLSDDGLDSISRLYGFNAIYLLNEAGKTVVTNSDQQTFALSSNLDSNTYSFWNVINGFTESHVQVVQNDPYNNDQDMLYTGISSRDGNGMILLTIPYDLFAGWNYMYSVETMLHTVGVDSQSMLLAIKSGSTTCVFDSSNRYTGLSLSDYGLSDAFLRNGYTGTHKFDGRDCLITARSVQDWNLLYITPTSWISATSWLFTALVIIIGMLVVTIAVLPCLIVRMPGSMLVVTIAVLPCLIVRMPGDDIRVPAAAKTHPASHRLHVEASVTRDGQIELVENQVEHHTLNKRWRKMNASDKLIYLIRIILVLLVCYLLFFILFDLQNGEHPLLEHILEQNWDKSLNVYAFSYVLISVSGIWIVAKLLQTITLFVTGTFSRRWKTLGILISNVIRYTALIASIFFTLQNIGVETSALITSASVLTLVFGLGCQSFVADMVAGVFLIFEGTFRVGDIVTVDNWRGEVVAIGLRSTNVKNELGNIKVFQNSRISGAINMTRDLTCAVCDIILPPGEPLEAFEEKLTSDFFPMAREHIQTIRLPLVYEGVVALNGDSATLRISVKCLESEREQLRRDLYRTLKLWREQK